MNQAYKIIKEEGIRSLNGKGLLLEHKQSGARVFMVSNEDENKVFNIAFRTPPKDDTGLPHIMEHSVLCGSRKYPLADPFVELAKGSLNTFLNAMTYPDKTIYPIASCNAQDYRNLMDVYLDAVFYPNIYNEPKILEQEGWHYELEDLEGELSFNGVVYNEMKGASSLAEQVLFKQINAGLFPNHPYGYDSGGKPEAITDLTKEDFLAFHKSYYHPSNSFIFLYGDIDVEEQLTWLDTMYLSQFTRIQIDSTLKIVPAFKQMHYSVKPYAVAAEAGKEKQTYLSYNVALPHTVDAYEDIALEVLTYLLLEAPGAFLKEALLDLGIGEDIFGSYDGALKQATLSVVVKNANPEDENIFIQCVEETLEKLVKEGIPKKKLIAAINIFEFRMREADFGSYPKGILYSIKLLDTWLYGGEPFECFDYDGQFKRLREEAKTGYFEQLVVDYILENTHKLALQLVPEPTLLIQYEEEMKNKLEAYKEVLSQEEQKELIEATKALKAYQSKVETAEVLASIPVLKLSDIDKKEKYVTYTTIEEATVKYVLHKTFTNDIVYITLAFDIQQISLDEVPYVELLTEFLGKLSTEKYSYSTLSDEMNLVTGGISYNTKIYGAYEDPNACQPKLEVSFKSFANKFQETVDLVYEIINHTQLEDTNRLKQLLEEIKSRQKMYLISNGHAASMSRASSYISRTGQYQDQLSGIGFYQFLEKIVETDDYTALSKKLAVLLRKIIRQVNTVVLINAQENDTQKVKISLSEMMAKLEKGCVIVGSEQRTMDVTNEGFQSAGKVQYCSLAGNYVQENYKYTGHMQVLQTIVGLDYMWREIRMKGGAYGGVFRLTKTGLMYLSSYRDPNLAQTYETYQALPKYIQNLDLDKRELAKYIIGTISRLDQPLTPRMTGEKALALEILERDQKVAQKERDEVLGTDVEVLRALAELVEKVLKQNHICTIGNEKKVEEEGSIFGRVTQLFKQL